MFTCISPHQDLADAFIARHKRMVTFWPSTVRSMVHLFQQLTDDQEATGTEAEEYYMIGVALVVPSVWGLLHLATAWPASHQAWWSSSLALSVEKHLHSTRLS